MDSNPKPLTREEELFLKRVAVKMSSGLFTSIPHAMQAVVDDDNRIYETYCSMPPAQRAEFTAELSRSIYEDIKGKVRV